MNVATLCHIAKAKAAFPGFSFGATTLTMTEEKKGQMGERKKERCGPLILVLSRPYNAGHEYDTKNITKNTTRKITQTRHEYMNISKIIFCIYKCLKFYITH